MVRRTNAQNDDDFAEEIFTDLSGNPDADPIDIVKDLDDEMASVPRRRARAQPDKEDDLEPVDETLPVDEEDEDYTPADDDDEDTPPVVTAPGGKIIFDPKDAIILSGEVQNLESRENNAKAAVDRAKAEIEAHKADLEAALDAGESKRAVELTDKLADAKVLLANSTGEIAHLATERAGLTRRVKELLDKAKKDASGNPIMEVVRADSPTTTGDSPQQGGSKLFPKFLKHNKWFQDPGHSPQAAVLLAIDKGLAAEGKLRKDDPAYFDELGRRFNKLHPGVFKNLDGKPIATGKRQRGNGYGTGSVPSGGGGGGERPQNPREIRLTQDDLSLMQTFGMDPQNKAHRHQWLLTKRADAAREAARG